MFDFNVNVKRDRDRMSAQSTQENAADRAADFAVDLWLPFVDNLSQNTSIDTKILYAGCLDRRQTLVSRALQREQVYPKKMKKLRFLEVRTFTTRSKLNRIQLYNTRTHTHTRTSWPINQNVNQNSEPFHMS